MSKLIAQAGGGLFNQSTLDDLNTAIFGNGSGANPSPTVAFATPRSIIGFYLPYIFTFAGIFLFAMLLWGGFEMLLSASDPKKQEAGKQRMIAALIGFLIIFSAFWLARIVETIFGISILG